jgi:pSer/pThr/pTyr-binding forkhead associated (FHA) protein
MSTPETSLSLSAALVHLSGEPARGGADVGKVIHLDRRLSIVGSKPGSHIRINSMQISGSHALLLNLGHQVLLRDAMSRSGVFVNDVPVRDCVLKCEDAVRFGRHQFRFQENALVVRQHPATARSLRGLLRVRGMPEPIPIATPMFVIGSRREADLHLEGDEVSQAHAVIFETGGRRMIRDLNSRLGIRVNGEKVQKTILRDGDVIGIGSWELRFSSSALRRARVLYRRPATGDSAEQSPVGLPRLGSERGRSDIREEPAEPNKNAHPQTLQDLTVGKPDPDEVDRTEERSHESVNEASGFHGNMDGQDGPWTQTETSQLVEVSAEQSMTNNRYNLANPNPVHLSDDERVTTEEDKPSDFDQQPGVTVGFSDLIESPIAEDFTTQPGEIGNEAKVPDAVHSFEIGPTVIDNPPTSAAEANPESGPVAHDELIESSCLATDWVGPERPMLVPAALDAGPVEFEKLDEPSLLAGLSSDDSVPQAATGTDAELAGGPGLGDDSAVLIEQLGTSERASPSPTSEYAADLTGSLLLDELSPEEPTSSPARATAVTTSDPLADIVAPEILPLFPDTPHADDGPQSRGITGRPRYPFILKLTLAAVSLFAIIGAAGAAGWWYLHHR